MSLLYHYLRQVRTFILHKLLLVLRLAKWLLQPQQWSNEKDVLSTSCFDGSEGSAVVSTAAGERNKCVCDNGKQAL